MRRYTYRSCRPVPPPWSGLPAQPPKQRASWGQFKVLLWMAITVVTFVAIDHMPHHAANVVHLAWLGWSVTWMLWCFARAWRRAAAADDADWSEINAPMPAHETLPPPPDRPQAFWSDRR